MTLVWGRVVPSFEALLYQPKTLLHGTLMYRKDVVQEFKYDEQKQRGSDYDLMLRVMSAGYTGASLERIVLLRRMHRTNMTRWSARPKN